MSAAAVLLDHLGRGDLRLGKSIPETGPRLPTGIERLDATLGGGLPRGRLSEVTGPRSAGRTALAEAIAGRATCAGDLVAWIDPSNRLDPESAAAAGIHLAHTLWIRPRSPLDALRAAEIVLGTGGFGLVVLDLADAVPRASAGQWARLRQTTEHTQGVLLLLVPSRTTADAALVLDVTPRHTRWSPGPGSLLLDGIDAAVQIARSRGGRAGHVVSIVAAAIDAPDVAAVTA